MKPLLEAIYTVCFIYQDDSRECVERHGLGTRDENSGKDDILLVDHPYIVQNSRSTNKSEYDGFTSENMRDSVKIPGGVIKLGSNRYMYCPSL